jgi:beta-galactosidase/beta-glucuronidase
MQATHRRAFLALALLLPTCKSVDAAWSPKTGPLATRYAKDVDPSNPLPEYPRPQMTRKDWESLNGVWEFQEGKVGEPPPFGHPLAERILVPFPIESSLSGINRPAERAWYRKTFNVPHAWSGRRTLLHFGAVDWECRVFVNGRELLVHRGGYDPFSVDVTPALVSPGPQEIVLGVYDPSDAGEQPRGKQVREPKGIWYTSTTGVWQTVWLEPVGVVHVDGVHIDPDPHTDGVELVVDAPRATPEDHVEIDVLEGTRVLASGKGRSNDRIRIQIPSVRRWSPDDPFLYDLEVRLVRGPVLEDTVRSYFGMRTIEVLKDEKGVPRLALNGKPLFMIGVLDQGFWPDGIYTAPTDEALRSDIELVKKLGFNLIRKHVKVEPERWYWWADRLGMLVWQDMPSGFREDAKGDRIELRPDSPAQFRDELKRLLESRRGHPSIVQWIVFNEGWGQHATSDAVHFVKGLDRTRLVTGASGWTDDGSGDVVDIHAYPGPAAPKTESARAAGPG